MEPISTNTENRAQTEQSAALRCGDGFGVWHPIETAPRGKEVLMFQPQEKSGQMMLPARMIVDRVPCSHFRATTHWMPLPLSPNTADQTTRRTDA